MASTGRSRVTYQHILYDVSEKIATITLHRPERMNAWTPIMERDVRHAMDAADYRWEMFDPVFDGIKGYAWSLSSFTSKIEQFKGQRVVIDGMSRFIVRDGLVAEYRESVNGGVAMTQLGVAPDRMTKVFKRWTGWLKERPETLDYLARPRGSRARTVV